MLPIFRAQWLQLKHNPLAVVIMTVLSVLLVLFIGGQTFDRVMVGAFPDGDLSEAQLERWLELLDDNDSFAFQLEDEAAVRSRLAGNDSGLAVRLGTDDFLVLAGSGDANAGLLQLHVGGVYRKELAILDSDDPELIRPLVEERLASPALTITAGDSGSEAAFAYDVQIHSLIGMGLFFASFTILFMVTNLLEDRRLGIWDRVIQSSTPRSAMYTGHLTFSYLTGLGQILLVFLLFNLVFRVDLGQNWPGVLVTIMLYTLAIVAIGLFLAGLVQNAQQMNVVIPIFAVSSAMLGGAYWPLEIVNNQLLLTLSLFTPIRHALDALKGIIYYDYSWAQLLPIHAILLGFAVVFMLLGLWLVDRRAR